MRREGTEIWKEMEGGDGKANGIDGGYDSGEK